MLSYNFIIKWWKSTELIGMLKQETRLQISNSISVELKKEYQRLVIKNSLRAQFPFYTNASALSSVIFRQHMK